MRLINSIAPLNFLILFFCSIQPIDWLRDIRFSPQTWALVTCGLCAIYHGGKECSVGIKKIARDDNPVPGFLYGASGAICAGLGLYCIVQAPNIINIASYEGLIKAWFTYNPVSLPR